MDYEETFAPVTRYTSIRAVMSLVSFMGWRIHQMDVKTTFLNGIIEEEVYTEQPRGFEVSGKESHICFAVNTLSQFMVEPRQEHWLATKHVLGYLRSTMEYGLRYI